MPEPTQQTVQIDPLTDLIQRLASRTQSKQAADLLAGGLERAAQLVPQRTATAVRAMADEPAMMHFRQHFATGQVEAELIKKVIDQVLIPALVAAGVL